jgi:acetoacetyl-CoA synthetase
MKLDYPLWKPDPDKIDATLMMQFLRAANDRFSRSFSVYQELWQWSIDNPEDFWGLLWDFCEVIGNKGERVLVNEGAMIEALWFPDACLNFAQNLLRRRDDNEAIVFWGEDRVRKTLTYNQLWQAVAQFSSALRAQGIKQGDVVAAYMSNMPETIIAMLAASSIGAIFTSASPDFCTQGLVDRFGQVEPKILIAVDRYLYNRKTINKLDTLSEVAPLFPSVERIILVSYDNEISELPEINGLIGWNEFIAPYQQVTEIKFEALPFDHPLYIMYSSGTTGAPKCIVHAAGRALLQHLKEQRLHSDIKPGDRLFFFTTCGWMMWNWLVSGLASEATIMLYDGSPLLDQGRILFDYAEQGAMTHFGTSAKFIDAIAKNGLQPANTHNLSHLKVIFSTGSPLVAESFEYVYRNVKQDVQLSSISGGTDILSCFVLGNPVLPVWSGEIQCRGLGMAVDVFNEAGKPVTTHKGELVCTKPFPAMPTGFWNDPAGERYQDSYFSRFSGIWCQGDFCEITVHDGLIIHGRSDATLNPGGVRIGSAEIYRQVEKLHEILESIVIGQKWMDDVRVVLFVKLRPGFELDEALIERIKQTIRNNTTPRHVPAKVLQVEDIPRTKSGKIVELAVRNVVHGEAVKNIEALANPEALAFFGDRPELKN